MNIRVKIGIYVVFLSGMIWFAVGGYNQYVVMLKDQPELSVDDLDVRSYGNSAALQKSRSEKARLVSLILGFVVCSLGFGVVLGRDISNWIGNRAGDFIFNESLEGVHEPLYDEAEKEWSNGNYLQAVELLREFLVQNPRQIHAQLRIAEIYEKDLNNYLAAALEYEDVLKQPLPRKRWGWAAIHLCNLYTSKLNQPEKGVALLQTIARDYPETPAAEKAKKRLGQLGHQIPDPATSPPPEEPPPPPPDHNLPPGFSPKKG